MKLYTLRFLIVILIGLGLAKTGAGQSTYLWEYDNSPLLFPSVMAASSDGSLATFGLTLTNDKYSLYFLKTDETGGLVAGKKYFIGGEYVPIDAAIAAGNGDYLVVGNGHPQGQTFALRLSPDGNIRWRRTYSYEHIDEIVEVSDGGFIFVGGGDRLNSLSRMILTKIDRHGEVIWNKSFSPSAESALGAFSIIGFQNDAIIAGVYFEDGANLLGLVRINSAGKIIWATKYRASGNNIFGGLGSITITDHDEIMVAASMRKGWNSADKNGAAVIKTDSTGKLLWSKFYETQLGDLSLRASSATTDEAVAWAGIVLPRRNNNLQPHAFLAKLNSDGQVHWKRMLKEYERSEFTAVAALADGTVAAAGRGRSGLLIRLSRNGEIFGGCDKYRSFPISVTNIVVKTANLSLSSRQLPLASQSFFVRTENFNDLGQPVCYGDRW